MQHRVAISLAYGSEKGSSNRPGSIKNWYAGEATVISGASIANTQGFPKGNLHPTTWVLPVKAGGIPLAQAIAALSGSGELTATGQLILSAVAALSGSGTLDGTMIGTLLAQAALSGTGELNGFLSALASIVSDMGGTGDLASTIQAIGSLAASINVTGDLLTTANVGSAVWTYLIEAGFSAEEIVRLLASITVGETSGFTGGATTGTFRDINDTKNRVIAVVDANGNRTNITLDPN